MSSSYVDADVKCPFYHACDQKKLFITCEGVSGTKANRMFFKNKKQQEEYLQNNCCSQYSKCSLYKILDKKYEKRTAK